MKEIARLLALSLRPANFGGTGQAYGLAHEALKTIRDATPKLAEMVKGSWHSTFFKDKAFKQMPQGQQVIAMTKDEMAFAFRDGYHIYFDGKREDVINNPITRWMELE